jgi:hypothetical protein
MLEYEDAYECQSSNACRGSAMLVYINEQANRIYERLAASVAESVQQSLDFAVPLKKEQLKEQAERRTAIMIPRIPKTKLLPSQTSHSRLTINTKIHV